jgi:hypothetical protein
VSHEVAMEAYALRGHFTGIRLTASSSPRHGEAG